MPLALPAPQRLAAAQQSCTRRGPGLANPFLLPPLGTPQAPCALMGPPYTPYLSPGGLERPDPLMPPLGRPRAALTGPPCTLGARGRFWVRPLPACSPALLIDSCRLCCSAVAAWRPHASIPDPERAWRGPWRGRLACPPPLNPGRPRGPFPVARCPLPVARARPWTPRTARLACRAAAATPHPRTRGMRPAGSPWPARGAPNPGRAVAARPELPAGGRRRSGPPWAVCATLSLRAARTPALCASSTPSAAPAPRSPPRPRTRPTQPQPFPAGAGPPLPTLSLPSTLPHAPPPKANPFPRRVVVEVVGGGGGWRARGGGARPAAPRPPQDRPTAEGGWPPPHVGRGPPLVDPL